MQGYKGLIAASSHVFVRRLNALCSGTPTVGQMLWQAVLLQRSLNCRSPSPLHASLVKLCRTYMLICHPIHLHKGMMGKGWKVQHVFVQGTHQPPEGRQQLIPQSPRCLTVRHAILQACEPCILLQIKKGDAEPQNWLFHYSVWIKKAEETKCYVIVKGNLPEKSIK